MRGASRSACAGPYGKRLPWSSPYGSGPVPPAGRLGGGRPRSRRTLPAVPGAFGHDVRPGSFRGQRPDHRPLRAATVRDRVIVRHGTPWEAGGSRSPTPPAFPVPRSTASVLSTLGALRCVTHLPGRARVEGHRGPVPRHAIPAAPGPGRLSTGSGRTCRGRRCPPRCTRPVPW